MPTTHSLKDLVALLSSNNDSDQVWALVQLKNLSSADVSNKSMIRECNAIPQIVQFLVSKSPDVRQYALLLLRSLSVNDLNQLAISDAGAIPVLIQLLKSRDEKLLINVAATLWNLAVNDINKIAVREHGGLNILAQLMANQTNVQLLNEIVGAIRNLSCDVQNRHMFIKIGVVPHLCQLLWSKKSTIRKNVCVTLQMICLDDFGLQYVKKENCYQRLSEVWHEFHGNQTVQNEHMISAKSVRPSKMLSSVIQGQHHVNHQSNTSPFQMDTFGTISWRGLELQEKIGKGAFSNVYRAKYHGFNVAVKILKDNIPTETLKREKVLLEFRLMSMLRHPNVLLLMGTSLTPNSKPVFVFEYCSRGTLKEVMTQTRSMLRRLHFARDIIAGLNWLHAHNIIHRDLKCANVLIDENWNAKIADLGLSLYWFDGVKCQHFKGNVKYAAPEILAMRARDGKKQYPYGPQTDVYSFAYILWELVTNRPLFPEIKGKEEITEKVCSGYRPEMIEGWPRSLRNMLLLCWDADPSRRPSFEIVQREFHQVLVDLMCPDPIGRKVVRSLWLHHENRSVPYSEFEKTFSSKTHVQFEGASLCYRRCLYNLVANPFDDTVDFERFCSLIQYCGPISPVETFLNSLVALFEQSWFFGFLRLHIARQMLVEQWQMTGLSYFLVRFSDATPGSFSIVSVNVEGVVNQYRLSHLYKTQFFVSIDEQDYSFSSLQDLVEYMRDTDVLRNFEVMPGSPYQSFFVSSTVEVRPTSPRITDSSSDVSK